MQLPADQHEIEAMVPEAGSMVAVVHSDVPPPDHDENVPENAVAVHDDAVPQEIPVIWSPLATVTPALQAPFWSMETAPLSSAAAQRDVDAHESAVTVLVAPRSAAPDHDVPLKATTLLP